ncbi:hypothetical protein [Nocardia sp. NPDC051832]|uniref:hypothetical protein n=1 Tax=Nocardia sp. NPDC051832 TaxID=3155673 RepID=UPI003417FF94
MRSSTPRPVPVQITGTGRGTARSALRRRTIRPNTRCTTTPRPGTPTLAIIAALRHGDVAG